MARKQGIDEGLTGESGIHDGGSWPELKKKTAMSLSGGPFFGVLENKWRGRLGDDYGAAACLGVVGVG
uniref:Uncharacterized protein n=1 Tax=Oryza punctata TaxID=4537 RepID=A0A0E0LYA7_ORYPU